MSDPRQQHPSAEKEQPRRSSGSKAAKVLAWIAGGAVLLLLALTALLSWYTTTSDFSNRVGSKLVAVLEDATGGRVELRGIHFHLWQLAIEADGLVIHGTEGPGEMPYLSADRILVHAKINTFLSHTVGTGAQSHLGLNYLRIEQPHFHLIIDKDGKTNQPVPKKPSTSTEPVQNTLLDLQAKQVELANGLAVVNDRAIPFDMAARDLEAAVHYIASSDRYGAVIDLNDLRTRMSKQPEAQSRLHVEAELGRDSADLRKLDFHSGADSELTASASIQHFDKPQYEAQVDGDLALKQISVLGGVAGLNAGSVELHVKGHSCFVEPQVAQKQEHFWRRKHPKDAAQPSTKVLPPDSDCVAGYLVVGNVKLHNAGYRDETVRLHDINGGAQLHVTPTELLFTALTGTLAEGGSARGELRISNWLGEVPPSAPAQSPTTVAAATTANKAAVGVGAKPPVDDLKLTPVNRAHAILNVAIDRIALRTILTIAAPTVNDLGFDTAFSGPVHAEWGGPATEIADSVNVDADVRFGPTGARRNGALANIPLTGQAVAHYRGKGQMVNIDRFVARTPQSTIEASGVLGLNKGDPTTEMRADLNIRDLGEYDAVLTTLGVQANGKKGSAALPIVLHGSLGFQGTARGRLKDLDVKGHLQANDLLVHAGSAADVHIDSVVADAEYAPRTGVSVASSSIRRGTAALEVGGTFAPRRASTRHGVEYVWDDGSTANASVTLNGASLEDVLDIAGQKGKYPVSGTLSLNAKVNGTLKALDGTGQVNLVDGVAYGEHYDSVLLNAAVQGKQITATQLLVKLHGMQVTGNGAYNLATEQLQAHVQGSDLRLSKFDVVQQKKLPVDGVVSLLADAKGTVQEPGLTAHVGLTDATYNGQPVGQATVDARTQGKVGYLTLNSELTGAQVQATATTQLVGDYDTKAQLTLKNLNLQQPLAIFSPGTGKVTSNIAALVTVDGPLKTPEKLSGTAVVDPLSATVQGYELHTAAPLRVTLANGTATLESMHIVGLDTDLEATGTAQVLGVSDPKGGRLQLKANGTINPAVAHTFNQDVTASGKVVFDVAADGRTKDPALTGKVDFQHVNAEMVGIANGLTDLNGEMQFNENRLEVKQLTATTGGGQITFGGFAMYKGGLYADVSLKAEKVRYRLNGLSTTANADIRLQGGSDGARLSGNVLITRFNVGADVDFAAFGGSGGVSAPPDPNSPLSKIRMDIHVQSAPQLDFQNSYAKLAGTVDLNVRGTLAEPSVLGRVQITDGSATFAGTKYQLQRGDIYFNNPVRIDPVIDLDATARVENYDLTIGVHGTTNSLKPTYRSEPPLSQADIFNLLALGKTQEEAAINNTQATQAGTDPTTSALLSGALNATLSSRVSKLFGGGSVKIDPAFVGTLGNTGPRITVQQQLSRQISVVFATNVNAQTQQLIQVTYALSENSSVVFTRDETGVFSGVYKIRKRYR